MTYEELSKKEVNEMAKRDRKELKQFEVDPPAGYETGKQKRIHPKLCYDKAFEYVGEKGSMDGVLLVHGLYQPPGEPTPSGHGWVEINEEIVFDGVLQRFYSLPGYYEYYNVKKEAVYTETEMWKTGREAGGHYGPWHKN